MTRLTEIGIQVDTYKATYHYFTEIYDTIFSKYKSPRILEIGVYEFGSIAMYLRYFDNPYIVAMDIQEKTEFLNDSWKFIHGDQTKISDLKKCVVNELPFNIILDDGGHSMKQQQIAFGFLIDYVKPGNYYILEDLHTSFRREYIEPDCQITTYDMLQKIQNKQLGFSNYIDIKQQQNILDKIEYIDIWAKNKNNLTDSVTSIIKLK